MNVRTPMPPILAALLLVTGFAGCSRDNGPNEAMRTVTAFQAALLRGDPERCRKLLTVESQQALADIAWNDVASKKPLRVISARREHHDGQSYRVQVLDPNNSPNDGADTAQASHASSAGQFVVVREYGRMVVDLVATAGLTARTVEASTSRTAGNQFEPRQLTPQDHDRIRQHELSQPPR